MTHMQRRLLGLFLGMLPLVASAEATRHELDPVHTRVLFAISHAGFSQALGTVSGSTGELWFDPEDWSSARLTATVPLTRVDLGDAKWNKAALAGNLLDVGKYPQATFASTRIAPIDATHATVYGTLTLHGVSQEVAMAVTLNAAKRHPMPPFRRTLGFSATTQLSRKAFGIDAWPSVIGDTVELRIEAEATRARGAGEPAETAPPPAEAATEPTAPAPVETAPAPPSTSPEAATPTSPTSPAPAGTPTP